MCSNRFSPFVDTRYVSFFFGPVGKMPIVLTYYMSKCPIGGCNWATVNKNRAYDLEKAQLALASHLTYSSYHNKFDDETQATCMTHRQ